MTSPTLLIASVAAPLTVVAAHFLSCRALRVHAGAGRSPQMFLIRLVLWTNVPLICGILAIAAWQKRPPAEWAWMLLFAVTVHNGISYSYFLWFNLSETSRRIRMLILIQCGQLDGTGETTEYTAESMVRARIARLLQMRQIEEGSDGRYRLKSRFFLAVAILIRAWRRLARL